VKLVLTEREIIIIKIWELLPLITLYATDNIPNAWGWRINTTSVTFWSLSSIYISPWSYSYSVGVTIDLIIRLCIIKSGELPIKFLHINICFEICFIRAWVYCIEYRNLRMQCNSLVINSFKLYVLIKIVALFFYLAFNCCGWTKQ
jgi:hypothetical protein